MAINKFKTVKIRDIGKVITGKTPPTSQPELFGDKYPFITPSDIPSFDVRYINHVERGLSDKGFDKQKGYALPKDTVCYVCIGSTIGKICLTNKVSFTNQQINSIIVNRGKFNPKYVYYLLRAETPKIQAISGGTGAGKAILNKSSFEDIDLNVYPLPIQNKIAAILSAYDDLIENNTRRIKILEEMAQLIYREWFVKFRFPGHEKVRMVDSELGPIPEGWKVKNIGSLLSHTIGGGWGKEVQNDKYTVPAYVIRGTDIPHARQGSIESCPLRYHTESNFRSRKLRAGDIVFEVSGGSKGQPVGRALLLNQSLLGSFDYDVICASFCKLIRPDKKTILPELIYLHLLEIYANGVIEKYQVQSTGITNFKYEFFLENDQILVPDNGIQQTFADHIIPIFDMIQKLGAKNRILRRTRDLLLPKLISGELDVEDLDIAVGGD